MWDRPSKHRSSRRYRRALAPSLRAGRIRFWVHQEGDAQTSNLTPKRPEAPCKNKDLEVTVGISSIPPITTIIQTPTRPSWGVFLGGRACCAVFLRVRAESCGLRRPHHRAGSAPGSLCSGHFSLHSSRPGTDQSPQDPPAQANEFNNLRADESTSMCSPAKS